MSANTTHSLKNIFFKRLFVSRLDCIVESSIYLILVSAVDFAHVLYTMKKHKRIRWFSQACYFYDFCFDSSSDRTLGILLFSAFKSRYKEVLTKAHTMSQVASTKILGRLTKEEVDCELDCRMNCYTYVMVDLILMAAF